VDRVAKIKLWGSPASPNGGATREFSGEIIDTRLSTDFVT